MAYSDHAFKARFPNERWRRLKAYSMMSGSSLNEAVNDAVSAFLDAQAADPVVRARLDANLRMLQADAEGFLDEQRLSDR